MNSTLLTLTIHDGNGKRTESINQLPVSIGKEASQSDIAVFSNYASRVHCQISENNGQLFIRDMSTNGTYVNDDLLKNDEMGIKQGDTLKLGSGSSYSDFALVSIDRFLSPIGKITPTYTPNVTPFSAPITPTVSDEVVEATDEEKFYENEYTPPQREVKLVEEPEVAINRPKCKIIIESNGKTETIEIFNFPCLIGREPQDERFISKVTIADTTNAISKEHLILSYCDGMNVKFVNLGANGCMVNGNKEKNEFEIKINQTIKLGNQDDIALYVTTE